MLEAEGCKGVGCCAPWGGCMHGQLVVHGKQSLSTWMQQQKQGQYYAHACLAGDPELHRCANCPPPSPSRPVCRARGPINGTRQPCHP